MRWIIAFHIVFMVTWFAGLFYLPRLFIYHRPLPAGEEATHLGIMERRLFLIMTIGMTLTIGLGIWLVAGWFWPLARWLEIKLALVGLVVLYHFYCLYLIRRLAHGECPHSDRFLRWFNELPGLLLILIVILAVVHPA